MITSSDSIVSIYDAAIAPDLWNATLNKLVKPIGAMGAILITVDHVQDHWNFSESSDSLAKADPKVVQHIQSHFFEYEREAWEFFRQQEAQVIVADDEFWTDTAALDEREDYQYTTEHLGFKRRLAARLNNNRSWFDNLALHFDKRYDHIPSGARPAMQLVLPHLAKAVELRRTFSILQDRYSAVLSALDYIEVGLCIVLPSSEIIVENLEASRILACGDAIQSNQAKQLFCKNPELTAQLRHAISQCCSTAKGEGNTAETLLVIPRASSRHPLLIEVVPLRDSTQEIERGLEGAMVTLIDAENPKPFSTEKVAQAYGLTTAEAAVCKLLVDGWTNNHIADERNVSPETVKQQVTSILSKTQTKRRSELIRLVLRTTPPIRAL